MPTTWYEIWVMVGVTDARKGTANNSQHRSGGLTWLAFVKVTDLRTGLEIAHCLLP